MRQLPWSRSRHDGAWYVPHREAGRRETTRKIAESPSYRSGALVNLGSKLSTPSGSLLCAGVPCAYGSVP